MRWLRGMAAATVALAVVMGAMVATAPSAAAEPAGCAAKDYLGKDDILRPGRALCNGNYLLRMQQNGDLVLREISTGRACWHSNTFHAGDAATFEPGHEGSPTSPPTVPELRVGNHVIHGENSDLNGVGTTANLNAKGEVWVGNESPTFSC